jgi:hypothetical protein
MNAAVDPLYSLGGGRCTGFEEWMTLYRRFHVNKCRISQSVYNGNNVVAFPFLFPVKSAEAAAGIAAPSLDTIMESRDAVSFMMMASTHPTNGSAISLVCHPEEYEGMPEGGASYDSFSGNESTDPAIQPAIIAGFALALAGAYSMTQTVVIEYTTRLFNPRLISDA